MTMKGTPSSQLYLHHRACPAKGFTRGLTRGFTIIEVMIVLVVTGALFLSAVLLISGKQNIAAYNQSIRSVQTELQQVVNEVGSGFYPNKGSITCTKSGGRPLLSSATAEQGTNKDCIFLGKVLQFAVRGTDPEQYNIFTMVGLRGDSLSPSLDLASAQARLIAKSTTDGVSNIPDATDTKSLLYGLTVSKMYYDGNPSNQIGAVGFISNVSSLGAEDSSQQVNVVAVTGTALHVDKISAVTQINNNLASAVVNPPGGVQICFNSGGTKQSGLVSIGNAGRQGAIELQIFSNLDCS
jgi:prepilin-type N-terminal cleavage/methylation domain-containing protein